MSRLSASCASLVIALCLAPAASADILMLPSGQPQVLEKPEQPVRGMHQRTVVQRFGEPLTRHPTVGQPPITRWDYDGFSVVFEGHHVIHTVVDADRVELPRH
ncbi:hypothetical protein [Ectothiorhodospira variabilis]|uniref:hypothetical protein n=1 Tax=Ectothiorhodospira variabilis TaxID=505694 RepID=UPI001EFC1667|nr:hypothetical protein [Ectothiorhodospira variabilis]MCG5493147.1 hypothetical protein [Ectothiorhodospira variabilis]MCG5502476.1 hypothetical protein [Ectothiorhodospira variabilis]MCG5505758.1 hypothetical protein [Ectothiorhodospira variabilis]